jgi:hypothetical protein
VHMTDDLLHIQYAPEDAPDNLREGYDRIVFATGAVRDVMRFDDVVNHLKYMAVGVEIKDGFAHVRYRVGGESYYFSPGQVKVVIRTAAGLELPRDQDRYDAAVEALRAHREWLQKQADLAEFEAALEEE